MIKALIFDMDGVIIDSEPVHIQLTIDVLKDVGATPTEDEIYEFIGVRNDEMWETLKKRHQISESVEQLMARQKAYKMERFFNTKLEPVDGVLDLLRAAKRKELKIALATSSPRYFAKYILKAVKASVFFDELVTADDILKSKPDPEIFLKAAQAIGVLPEECLVIEDAYFGIMAAKKAGMKCIGFRNPNSGNQDLSLADYVVSSLRDINLDEILNLTGEAYD
ncbi:MAG TPA: HAD family phosphatase [Clostridiaceae bacterium]|nr:HAD family phosphatase [Clostridiaceae bacterium]